MTKACICRPSSTCPPHWANPALIEKWKRIRELRRVVTGALELERAAKKIGSSLEAAPTLYVESEADAAIVSSVPFAEIAITSGAGIGSGARLGGRRGEPVRAAGRAQAPGPCSSRRMATNAPAAG